MSSESRRNSFFASPKGGSTMKTNTRRTRWNMAAVILAVIAISCQGSGVLKAQVQHAGHLITISSSGEVDADAVEISKGRNETVRWKAPKGSGDWLVIFASGDRPLRRWAIEVPDGGMSAVYPLRAESEIGRKYKYSIFSRKKNTVVQDPVLIVRR